MNRDEILRRYAAGERDFHRTNLSGANLSGVNLSGVNLSGANLSGANLSGANLSGMQKLTSVDSPPYTLLQCVPSSLVPEQLQGLMAQPSLREKCPSCGYQFPAIDLPLVHCDCSQCGWVRQWH
ncbi:MAG TPA: pentapeptide repeat-containing protein [Candidatus Caenarcaniphilales bacterium]